MRIVFLLGAGFSIPAGFPSGQQLNEFFINDIENKIIGFHNGTWKYNDSIGNCYVDRPSGYLLSELIEGYYSKYFEIFDYELFYDYLLSKHEDYDFVKNCCNKVLCRIKKELNKQASENMFGSMPTLFHNLIKVYNFIIADLLGKPYQREEKQSTYNKFIDMIDQADEVDIFSLNHDTLLEYIFESKNISYSDGFSSNGSCITDANGQNKFPIFKNQYINKTRIYKLHGSINYFKFDLNNQAKQAIGNDAKYHFFKRDVVNYNNDESMINPETGKVIQQYYSNITPQFLTGKNKPKTIESHLFYKSLNKNFEDSFQKADKVVIIGYSYRDNYINKALKNAIDKYNFELINVNPTLKYPFRKNYSRGFVKQLKSIEEL